MKTHTQLVKRFIAALMISILVLVFPNSPAADFFKDGGEAYEAGDFRKALEIFKSLAEQGDAPAQFNLGLMYDKGRGISQDYGVIKIFSKEFNHG